MRDGATLKESSDQKSWTTALAGGALVLLGIRQRSWMTPVFTAAGTALIYRGATGQNPAQPLLESVTDGVKSGIHVHRAVTIRRPADEVYAFWRHLENLPRFMEHIKEVEDLGEGRSRWHARIPGPVPVSWEALIVRDEPARLLEWKTVPDSRLEHWGRVQLLPAPNDYGTELHVEMSYRPPMGVAGAAVARMLNIVTEQQIKEEIRHCKHILEAGEIPTVEGQPSGRSKA